MTTQLDHERQRFSEDIASRIRVFLDAKFWIKLRDASLGDPQNPTDLKLLELLKARVESKEIVCPLEQFVFIELLKQRESEKRAAMVALVDWLSEGACLIPSQERLMHEALTFLLTTANGGAGEVPPLDWMWTKIAHVLGHVELELYRGPTQVREFFAQVSGESLWSLSLAQLLEMAGDPFEVLPLPWENSAEFLNRGKAEKAAPFRSRMEMFQSELRGCFDAHAEGVGRALDAQHIMMTGRELAEPQREEIGKRFAGVLANACQLRDLSKQFPTCHVLAAVYTEMQWDKGRRYKPNDIPDFAHAASALPYCDHFLTERPLKTVLSNAGLLADAQCQVIITSEEALAVLQ